MTLRLAQIKMQELTSIRRREGEHRTRLSFAMVSDIEHFLYAQMVALIQSMFRHSPTGKIDSKE